MSVRTEIVWEGLDDFKRHLSQTMPVAFKKSLEDALNKAAEDGKERAKHLVPVDTGSLKRSIRRERHAWPAKNIIYTGIRAGGYIRHPLTGRYVDYAGYVEYGTRHQRPQPFLRPALRYASRRIPKHFWEALSRRVKVG